MPFIKSCLYLLWNALITKIKYLFLVILFGIFSEYPILNRLSRNKIGIWHTLDKQELTKNKKLKISEVEKNIFFKNLFKIGYSKKNLNDSSKNRYLRDVIKAFQRRFRQEIINGVIDQECLLISKNLTKTYN